MALLTALSCLSFSVLSAQDPEQLALSQKSKPQLFFRVPVTQFRSNDTFPVLSKAFESGEGVVTLVPIKKMEEVYRLTDYNRFATVTAPQKTAPTEADRAAAAAIARPGVSEKNDEEKSADAKSETSADAAKDTPAEEESEKNAAAASQEDGVPEDAKVCVMINGEGVLFALKCRPVKQSIIEIQLLPEDPGLYGNSGVHLFLRPSDMVMLPSGWVYRPDTQIWRHGKLLSYPVKQTGEVIYSLYFTWTYFFNMTGTFPVNSDYASPWRFNVFRWIGKKGASLNGEIPQDSKRMAFLLFPKVSSRNLSKTMSDMMTRDINAFYAKKTKQEHYFNGIVNHLAGARSYQNNFGLRMRLGNTQSFSERCLAEDKKMMADYKKEALARAQKVKENSAMSQIKSLFDEHYWFFADWRSDMQRLRLQALRNNVFGNEFGEE